MEFLAKINDPVLLALASTCFTWFMTALGAGMVFFFKEINKRVLNMMLGFAAGIMVAASFWSLLEPAIEMAQSAPIPAWLVAAIGFVGGAGFLCLADHVMPHAHFFAKEGQTEGIPTHLKRSILLVFSITLHNIPEGMAVGVTIAGALAGNAGITITGAFALSLGIAIQNFPEGAIVSMPLKGEGMGKPKAFLCGMASGAVEPVFGFLTILLAAQMTKILPYFLSFAAGAMIYVVVEELIPEAQAGEHTNIGTIGTAIGFALMMVLDVALG